MKKILLSYLFIVILSFSSIVSEATFQEANAGMFDKILRGASNVLKGTKKILKGKKDSRKINNQRKSDFKFGKITDSKPSKIGDSNRQIVNGKYAVKKYPVENLPYILQRRYPDSVDFNKDGYPDFSPYARTSVKIKDLNGIYANDISLANKNAGFERTPDGYTWHHHQDGETMLLVPKDLHEAVRHQGGVAKLKNSDK